MSSSNTASYSGSPSLGTIIAARIVEIQKRHHAETGAWLSISEAFEQLEREEANPLPELDVPPSRSDIIRVQAWLAAEHYDPQAIRWAIADLERTGTAQYSLWIDDADRDAVEAMLHDSQWSPVWSSTRVDLTPHGLSLASA
jgi:hypothetical protein